MMLNETWIDKLAHTPEWSMGAQKAHMNLKDGRMFDNVCIASGTQVMTYDWNSRQHPPEPFAEPGVSVEDIAKFVVIDRDGRTQECV